MTILAGIGTIFIGFFIFIGFITMLSLFLAPQKKVKK